MRAELDGVDGKSLLEFLMYENVAESQTKRSFNSRYY